MTTVYGGFISERNHTCMDMPHMPILVLGFTWSHQKYAIIILHENKFTLCAIYLCDIKCGWLPALGWRLVSRIWAIHGHMIWQVKLNLYNLGRKWSIKKMSPPQWIWCLEFTWHDMFEDRSPGYISHATQDKKSAQYWW